MKKIKEKAIQILVIITMLSIVSSMLVLRDYLIFHYYTENALKITDQDRYSTFQIKGKKVRCAQTNKFYKSIQWGEKIYFIDTANQHENVFTCNMLTGQISRITDNSSYRFMNIIEGFDHSFLDPEFIYSLSN